MADATRLQTLSKQSGEQRQATEVITTQIDELIQSHRRMEAMMAALMSQGSNQLSRPPDPPYSEAMMKNHCNQASISPIRLHETNFSPTIIPITSSKLPKPPDPPDIRKSEQNLATKELVEPAVEEISNKSVNMIREKEPSPENESRPEVSVSQFQVPLSSMEPSRRCRNVSLDVVDKDMCDEPVCGKDGDYTLTVSAKFREICEDPQFELVCLKQPHDPALTRSSLQHTPTDQYRAPFSPYRNCNDTGHYKREFGNDSEPEIEFDRECEEIEDDELKDKQPEEDVETLVISETEHSLECVDDESSVESAARSKERKMRYIVELEHKVQTLQTEATTLSAQLTHLQRDMIGLTNQNNELKFRLQAMKQQARLREARNIAVTKALILWKEHPPDQIKDSHMYVLVSENQCQDYSPLLFLERVKDSFEFMLMVDHFENPLVSILTQEVFHLQRPPEIPTKSSSPNILNFILSSLRTRMF